MKNVWIKRPDVYKRQELDEAYQQFLKKMKAEGKLDEDKINEANSAKAIDVYKRQHQQHCMKMKTSE